MPLAKHRIARDRVNFDGALSAAEIDTLLQDSELRVLQTSSAPDPLTCRRLNDSLFAQRPLVELRVYDFQGGLCDLGFLRHLDQLRHFSADFLQQVVGLECLAALDRLQSLAIGVAGLRDFDFLAGLASVHTLYLGKTEARHLSLGVLRDLGELRVLYLERQRQDIGVLSALPLLQDLTLRGLTLDGLDFLPGVAGLTLLDIKLCTVRDWSALCRLSRLKFLELWQPRGLYDLDFLPSLAGLQYLFLQELNRIAGLPDLSTLGALRRVQLEQMRGLLDVSALESAPALRELIHHGARGQPQDYAGVLQKPGLRAVVDFRNAKKNAAFLALATQYGVPAAVAADFDFV